MPHFLQKGPPAKRQKIVFSPPKLFADELDVSVRRQKLKSMQEANDQESQSKMEQEKKEIETLNEIEALKKMQEGRVKSAELERMLTSSIGQTVRREIEKCEAEQKKNGA